MDFWRNYENMLCNSKWWVGPANPSGLSYGPENLKLINFLHYFLKEKIVKNSINKLGKRKEDDFINK